VTEPTPAEIVRRLKPIPTYRDHPATSPVDIEGVDPDGNPVRIPLVGTAAPVLLLLFLSATCLGCHDLWEGTPEVRRALPPGVRIVIVTLDPTHEDATAIAALAPADAETVMSTQAFAAYRVAGPPFMVVVEGDVVRTEGVAWGITETARAARAALEGAQ
jgi:hypothetical protein